MVSRQRAIAGRKRRAAKVGQLLGMQLYRQAKRAGRIEHPRNLFGRKRDPLAEPVHRIDQPFRLGRAQGRNADLVDIGVGAALEFGGHRVGAEIAGDDPHLAGLPDGARGAQHPQFGLAVQPVAGFHLDQRDALGDHRVDVGQGGGNQRVQRGRAGGGDGGHDAAPGARHLFIAGPVQAHLELLRAVAAVNHMGVAIDQRGRDQPPAKRGWGVRAPLLRQVRLWPDPLNAAIADRNRRCLDQAIGLGAVHRGGPQVGQQEFGTTHPGLGLAVC